MVRIASILGISVGLLMSGCGPLIPVEQVTEVEGSYDTMTRYDFSAAAGMVAQSAGSWVSPEQAIRKSVESFVQREYGEDIARALSNQFGGALEGQIRSYLGQEAPAWVLDIEPVLAGVEERLGTFDVQSTWVVRETTGGQFEVTQIWNGFALFDDPSCRTGSSLLCKQTSYTTQALLESEFPVEIVSSTATAVATDGGFFVDAHTVEFNYGRLALYVLVDALLPQESREGTVGLRDVALAAINCRGMAGRLAGDDGVLGFDVGGVRVGLSLNDLIGSCEDGVFGSVNRLVDRFNVPLNMEVSSSATLVDTNFDGRINRLDNGRVDGLLNLTRGRAAAQSGPVSGDFTGFRVGSFGR